MGPADARRQQDGVTENRSYLSHYVQPIKVHLHLPWSKNGSTFPPQLLEIIIMSIQKKKGYLLQSV